MRKCSVAIILLFVGFMLTGFPAAAGEKAVPDQGVVHIEKRLAGGAVIAGFWIVPTKVRFACAYENPPKTVEDFALQGDALLTVNGGYWDVDYRPTDLLVVNGKQIKKPNTKNHHFGLFYVKARQGYVRDLRYRPLCPKEKFEHAIKCGPTLVLPGGKPNPIKSTSRHARIAVGRDKSGKLFFAMNKLGRMSYQEMTEVLLAEPFNADYAFNLDGGPSVGYYFRPGGGKAPIQSRSQRISSVIQVFGK